MRFGLEKIAAAMQKAFRAGGGERDSDYLLKLAMKVDEQLAHLGMTEPTVEQVQDVVEQVLMESGHVQTAKRYMIYRAERTKVRERNTQLMQTFDDITHKSSSESELKRENANVNGDTAIAIKSHGNVDWFFEELDRKLDLCIEQLLERLEIQSTKKVRNFPFLFEQTRRLR